MSAVLVLVVLAVAVTQFFMSSGGVLSAWKGGGFGMYTTPHGVVSRATFLTVKGQHLRLSPPDPDLEEWIDSVDLGSAAFLDGLLRQASLMRTYPRAEAADRLIRGAARVVWDKALFGSATDIGKADRASLAVTVVELARRTSDGQLETRVVFQKAGE